MEPIRRAVIDVGTNSVKLLVAEVADHDIRPLHEESKQTRLGEGFYETHRLRPEAIAATAKAAAVFAAQARQWQAASIRVIATNAAREAVNAGELTSAIEQAPGLKVEVISGEQEAAWGFQGVTSDPQFAQTRLLLLDVGGGSAQFTLGQGGHMSFHHSFPVGSVRLLEQLPPSDPPKPEELAACREWLREFLRKEMRPKLGAEEPGPRGGDGSQSLLTGVLPYPLNREGERPREPKHVGNSEEIRAREDARPPFQALGQHGLTSAAAGFGGGAQLVGVGGTASILGCMEARLETFDRERLEATRLGAARVSWHLESSGACLWRSGSRSSACLRTARTSFSWAPRFTRRSWKNSASPNCASAHAACASRR